jgi:YD repeat-containing protein
VLDAKSRYTYFTYDDLDRLVSIDQDAESLVTSFQYDAAGNVTKVTDPKSQETDYAYDALSRLTSVEQPLGHTVSYAYDGRGRLAATTNARGHVLRYAYHRGAGSSRSRSSPTAPRARPRRRSHGRAAKDASCCAS